MRRESAAAVLVVVVCVCVIGARICVVRRTDQRSLRGYGEWRILLLELRQSRFSSNFSSGPSEILFPTSLAKCKAFFEQNGLCFSFYPSTEEGMFCINAIYQNRYDHHAQRVSRRGRLRVSSGRRWDLFGRTFQQSCSTYPAVPGHSGLRALQSLLALANKARS